MVAKLCYVSEDHGFQGSRADTPAWTGLVSEFAHYLAALVIAVTRTYINGGFEGKTSSLLVIDYRIRQVVPDIRWKRDLITSDELEQCAISTAQPACLSEPLRRDSGQ